ARRSSTPRSPCRRIPAWDSPRRPRRSSCAPLASAASWRTAALPARAPGDRRARAGGWWCSRGSPCGRFRGLVRDPPCRARSPGRRPSSSALACRHRRQERAARTSGAGARRAHLRCTTASMDRIAIVGLGLIGGSLALSLRDRRPSLRILGIDLDAQALRLASEAGAIEGGGRPQAAALETCDMVVLATPAAELMDAILPAARRIRPTAVLTDVCGAKEAVCGRAAQQDRVVFVGAHPMAGTEFRGF